MDMISPCPLCSTEHIKEIFKKNAVPYFRCLSCGFLFSGQTQNPNLDHNTLEEYEPAYIHYLEDSPEDAVNFSRMLAWIERFKPLKGLRVLDIGTGTGKLVRYLRRDSVDAYGIEPSAALYNRYLSREPFFFLTDIQGLPGVSAPQARYDAVIISDVLEHVRAPRLFFHDLGLVLNRGAVIYVCTPNADSFFARLCGKNWHYINKYHFSFFSRGTLRKVAEEHGLNELGFAHFTRFRSIGYIGQYFIDFVAKGSTLRVPDSWYQKGVALNLHDLMQIIYQYD